MNMRHFQAVVEPANAARCSWSSLRATARPARAAVTCVALVLAQVQHNDADVLPQLACVGELPRALGALQAARSRAAVLLRGQWAGRAQTGDAFRQLFLGAWLLCGPLRPAPLPLQDGQLCQGNQRTQWSHRGDRAGAHATSTPGNGSRVTFY